MKENQRPQGEGVPPPEDVEGAAREQAGKGGKGGSSRPAEEPDPLASEQLAESPQSETRIADDPLAGKQPADAPLGSDPLTLDRRNPPRAPGA